MRVGLGGTTEAHVLSVVDRESPCQPGRGANDETPCSVPYSHLAEIITSFLAHPASTTVVTAFDGDAVTDLEPGLAVGVLRGRGGGFGTDRGDDTSRFVAQHEGVDDLEISVCAMEVVVDYEMSRPSA